MEITDKRKIPWAIPDFGEAEKNAIKEVVDSGWMTMGKQTRILEKKIALYTKRRYNLVFNSGTSAITAALLALGAYHEGYTARIPSYTYKATENACLAAGLRDIKYGDVDPYTGLMKPRGDKPRYEIQVPVHYAGLPLNPDTWGSVNSVVEDAAESFGSTTKHIRYDDDNRLVCYSFHAAKLITMIEGGLVATDNEELYEKLRAIRVHGENPNHKGEFITRGFNFKPLDICSSVGVVQLDKVGSYIANRNLAATLYKELIGERVEYQHVPDYVHTHSYMMFPIYVDEPEKLALRLREHGIDTRLGWKPLGKGEGADYMWRHVICLPMYNTITPDDVSYVSHKVIECL